MRIAQIAPLWESVPPKTYGGTELVVHLLVEELAQRGHEVVLFATGDSQISRKYKVNLVSGADQALRAQGVSIHDAIYYELPFLEKIFSRTDRFDIIHNHMGYQALPFASFSQTPVVTTLHGIFDPPGLKWCYEQYPHMPYVSISDFQRIPSPDLNYVATVYHGLRANRFTPCYQHYKSKDYLAFLGRISPEKGVHHAIRIAKETGWKLRIAAKVDPKDYEYYATMVEPLIDGTQIQYIGEVGHPEKVDLLRNAAATLCPITWPEPFGLVLMESLACGTPVLTIRNGSVPEIMEHGKTGFIGESPDDLVEFVANLNQIDRQACRRHVEEKFSVKRMVDDYLAVYERLVEKNSRGSLYLHPTTHPLGKKERVHTESWKESRDKLAQQHGPL